jgi:hypothetical protein
MIMGSKIFSDYIMSRLSLLQVRTHNEKVLERNAQPMFLYL